MRRLWVPSILVLWSECLPGSPPPRGIPEDYHAFLSATEARDAGRLAEIPGLLEPVWKMVPASPLSGRAAVLAANSYSGLGRPSDAVAVLRRHSGELPQPEAEALLARSLEATGDLVQAVGSWQKICLRYPLSRENDEAEAALARLRVALGSNYPPLAPEGVLSRAEQLRKAGRTAKARAELLEAVPFLSGRQKEEALVRANFYDGTALGALALQSEEADAERIYLMHAAARRQSQFEAAEAALRKLEAKYPDSPWTKEALISWGNHWSLRNEPERYVPLYQRCYTRFGSDKQAAYCHWKVAWASWMARDAGARRLMAEHVAKWPESEKAAAALYFLGRYNELASRWPNSWYAVLSRPKLKDPPSPQPRFAAQFSPDGNTRLRMGRARQLTSAGLAEWAEVEMRFAATEQPFVVAMELAEIAQTRSAHDQALRYIKSVARGYLNIPFNDAPARFWRLAFPLPYRDVVIARSREAGLDPYLVAALIRQESEFNPQAISRAKAYGLTQVMPATGRDLYRRLRLGTFSTDVLFDPDTNLRLGTHYFGMLISSLNGNLEQTLAAYNAGKSRVDKWSTWYKYREAAEFVETIPFSETREYVQVVLRNADMYRRIWGNQTPAN